MKNENSMFQQGSGCFKCKCCGRRTRENGNGNSSWDVCPDCQSAQEHINGIHDASGDFDSPENVALLDGFAKRIAKKGGNPAWILEN